MKLLYVGKTKDVYDLQNGHYLLKFKDSATGEDGKFDPGANTVGLSIEGAGRSGLRLAKYFFEKAEAAGIPTHFVSADIQSAEMTVHPARPFGSGLEVICRYKATGSFMRRYGGYAREGQDLDGFVEVTLKDDERGDPPICSDALELLGILPRQDYDTLVDLTRRVAGMVRRELAERGLELFDIKLEFARVGEDGRIALIDEISGGSMRAYKGGRQVELLELEALLLGSGL
jgi:phosphoribosylaminoimidazole-succinocarboxamide synthase